MTDSAAVQFVLASAAVGALALLALGARRLCGTDPRARERTLAVFLPVLFAAPLAQFGAAEFLPDSWRPRFTAPAGRAPSEPAARAGRRTTVAPPGPGESAAPGSAREHKTAPPTLIGSARFDAGLAFIVLYGIGASIALLRLGGSIVAAARIISNARPADNPCCLAAWRHSLRDWPVGVRTPRLLVSSRVSTPACGGLFRPCVLLPLSVEDATDAGSLAAALRHELGHARRRDPVRALAEGVLLAIHWLNPAVFLFVRTLRADRECARDADAALAANGREPYALALVHFAELARARSPVALAAMAPFVSPHSLKRRLAVLSTLDPSARPFGPRAAGTLGAALVLAACGTVLHAAACAAVAVEPPRSIGPATVKSASDRRVEIAAPPGPRRMAHVVQSLGKDPGRITSGAESIGTLTEQETVADFRAEGAPEGAGRPMRASELRANLPEGSGLTMVIEGSGITTSNGVTDLVRFTVKDPAVRITDTGGVSRLIASSVEPGSTFTIVARESAGEASFHIMAHKNDKPVDVSITFDTETGRGAGEKDPPAGSVRWQLLPESKEKPATRLKIQWIHDDRTLADALRAEEAASERAR